MFWDVIVLFSHALNRITGGSMHEPFSARCYAEKLVFEKYINLLFFFDKDHCKRTYYANLREVRELVRVREP